MSDDFLPGYDAWKTREPRQWPTRHYNYSCLDCRWRGRDAFEHHREAHHRIVLTHAPQWGVLQFTCCQKGRSNEL
jgi:hypothetical protein